MQNTWDLVGLCVTFALSYMKEAFSLCLEHWKITDVLAFKQNRKKVSDENF